MKKSKEKEILDTVRKVEDVISELFFSNSMMHFATDEIVKLREMPIKTEQDVMNLAIDFKRSKSELEDLTIRSNFIVKQSREQLEKVVQEIFSIIRGDNNGTFNS